MSRYEKKFENHLNIQGNIFTFRGYSLTLLSKLSSIAETNF